MQAICRYDRGRGGEGIHEVLKISMVLVQLSMVLVQLSMVLVQLSMVLSPSGGSVGFRLQASGCKTS